MPFSSSLTEYLISVSSFIKDLTIWTPRLAQRVLPNNESCCF